MEELDEVCVYLENCRFLLNARNKRLGPPNSISGTWFKSTDKGHFYQHIPHILNQGSSVLVLADKLSPFEFNGLALRTQMQITIPSCRYFFVCFSMCMRTLMNSWELTIFRKGQQSVVNKCSLKDLGIRLQTVTMQIFIQNLLQMWRQRQEEPCDSCLDSWLSLSLLWAFVRPWPAVQCGNLVVGLFWKDGMYFF